MIPRTRHTALAAAAVAAATGAASASVFTTHSQADWLSRLAFSEALSTDAGLGQYGGTDLAGDFALFPGFPSRGPTDPDAANYVAPTLTLTGSTTTATVSADNTLGDSFFHLDDPNDGNDVDTTPGGGHPVDEAPRYLSFYGNNSSLILDFEAGVSAFAMDVFDLDEGPIFVEWSDGETSVLENLTAEDEPFFGVADGERTITRVTLTTQSNQGVAFGRFYVGTVVPSPTSAATLALVGLTLAAARRRRA